MANRKHHQNKSFVAPSFSRKSRANENIICGGGDAFPRAVHAADRPPEMDALHLDLIDRFGALGLQVKEARRFGLRRGGLLFQFRDLE
jgi:hypothetical protein